MRSAFTYYRDIPLSKEEYALKIGMSIIDTFVTNRVDSITIIPFDKSDYAQWLGKKKDTQDMRAAWVADKIAIKKVLYKELADYLGFSESAIKQYDPVKRELMLIGLAVKQKRV